MKTDVRMKKEQMTEAVRDFRLRAAAPLSYQRRKDTEHSSGETEEQRLLLVVGECDSV